MEVLTADRGSEGADLVNCFSEPNHISYGSGSHWVQTSDNVYARNTHTGFRSLILSTVSGNASVINMKRAHLQRLHAEM